MSDARERIIELLENAKYQCDHRDCDEDAEGCEYHRYTNCWAQFIADHLIANGVTIQSHAIITVERLHERIANLKNSLAFAQKGYAEACATMREKISKCDDASLEETVDRYIRDVRHYAAKVNALSEQIKLLEYIIAKDAE